MIKYNILFHTITYIYIYIYIYIVAIFTLVSYYIANVSKIIIISFPQYLTCNPVSADDPGLRYYHSGQDDYYLPSPQNVDRLNYYLERQAEGNIAGAGEGNDYQFIRPARRASSKVLRDHLFNTWMKKARGSIRRKFI